MSSEVILLQRPYISISSPLLLIIRREITAAAVALLILCQYCIFSVIRVIDVNRWPGNYKNIENSIC